MAIVNVRNLPEDIHGKLRVRAALAGRSMEAEVRAIIIAAINGNMMELTGMSRKTLADQRTKDYRALMKQLRHVTPGRTFTREEANERG